MDVRQPWRGNFQIDQRDIRYRQFDGSQSKLVTRETFVTGEAAVVLPYDPARDQVVLIEQFRVAVQVRGNENPWVLECAAGRIDPGEIPEETARRETLEECGLVVDTLLPAAKYYPSVGGQTGYFHTFVGICKIGDDAAGTFGLAEEAEDIKTHIVAFQDALDMAENGDINTGPLILLLHWLSPRRAALRRSA